MQGITNDGYTEEQVEEFALSNLDINGNQNDKDKNTDHKETSKFNTFYSKYKKHIVTSLVIILNILVFTYFGFATSYYIEHDRECYKNCSIEWCDGYGMLILVFGFIYTGLIYFQIIKPYLGKPIQRAFIAPITRVARSLLSHKLSKYVVYVVILAAFVLFCYFETKDSRERLASLLGMVVLVMIAILCSKHPTKIKVQTVLSGIVCQFLLGIFCIRWDVGRMIFTCIGDKVTTFLNYSSTGASFVYGDFLVYSQAIFAFAVLSVIYFFSFFISVLYYMGAMQWVVIKLGWILQSILGTTVCESVIASANIFLGMSESALLIKPYLKSLTLSEIHALMASGFATTSGTVLAAYVSFGAEPAHLITSSVMAAPAALAFAKIMYPETEISKTTSDNIKIEESKDSSVLDAATNGANAATALILGIIANLIAFVSFIAFINGLLSWFGFLVGHEDLSLEGILGTIFRPLAYILGVPWDESKYVGNLIGTKSIINEFVAYQKLGEFKKLKKISPRSAAIATYAICGFANPSSMGILIGALGAMEPLKRTSITKVAFRAFVCGSLICFMTASIAGLLMNEEIFNEINN